MKGVTVYLDDKLEETGVITKRQLGVFTVKTKASKRIQISDRNIIPYEWDDFIAQQLDILQQVFTFADEYDLFVEFKEAQWEEHWMKKFSCKYPIESIRAIESPNDTYSRFGRYLAVYRCGETIPYAFLKEASNYDADNDDGMCINIDESSKTVNIKLPYIRCSGHVYLNKKTLYSLDMGIMYLFLLNQMFREAFLSNITRIQMICDGTQRFHVYDANQQVVHFDHNGVALRVVGFQMDLPIFVLKRKTTYTYERDLIYRQPSFTPLESTPPHIFLIPWHPMQFVHLQLVYALHMLEYLTVELKIEFDMYPHWKGYKDICGHLFVKLEKAEKGTMLKNGWNPNTAIELIAQFDPRKKYILPISVFQEVWHCKEKQHAWLSNLQHLVELYTNIFTHEITDQEFLLKDSIVVINNQFLGSFHVNPVQMQASMVLEEKKMVSNYAKNCFQKKSNEHSNAHSTIVTNTVEQTYTKTKEETIQEDFLPDLSYFSGLSIAVH
jgi:hypothetical protein